MIVSDITDNVQLVLNDPTGAFWNQSSNPNELLQYANQYCRWAMGLKPDLTAVRVTVNLAPGSDQVIPADGFQFLDADWTGNGQAVFVLPLETIKHSKFAKLASADPTTDIQAVAMDERVPAAYYVFPPAADSSGAVLQIKYAKKITPMASYSSAYVLPDESADSAFWYILCLCYRKATDRQDLQRAAECYTNALQWFGLRTQVQGAVDAKPDE